MITESKVTEIFCIADDFCKEFEVEMSKNALSSSADATKRRRKRMMSDAEVITILICFHFNTYRNFKHYYLREFGIRNAIKKLNRQLEKVAYSFGNFADI